MLLPFHAPDTTQVQNAITNLHDVGVRVRFWADGLYKLLVVLNKEFAQRCLRRFTLEL